jgi:excisionase family DNA binding protein
MGRQTATLVKRLVTTKEAAKYLAMSDWSIRQLVRLGKLPIVSGCEECNWRFDVRDLDEYVDSNKQWNAGEE